MLNDMNTFSTVLKPKVSIHEIEMNIYRKGKQEDYPDVNMQVSEGKNSFNLSVCNKMTPTCLV